LSQFFFISGGVHVYILDSGLNTNHPDFGGRAQMEASFIDYEDNIDYAGHGKLYHKP
jgi:subtilisin family serine protease